MLGLLGSSKHWQWAACGKHPVVKDFFYIGQGSSLLKAFSDWVENGYNDMATREMLHPGHCSWRFWANAPQKEVLISGLLKDSSDYLGRYYPLLIFGIGMLPEWEKYWDLLPYACEKTWNQIENISTSSFKDLTTLENEVKKIKSPDPQWQYFTEERNNLYESSLLSSKDNREVAFKQIEETIVHEIEEGIIVATLEDSHWTVDQFALVNLWNIKLKNHSPVIPHAVFMGGTPEMAYLIFFKRPLAKSDFNWLWSKPFIK